MPEVFFYGLRQYRTKMCKTSAVNLTVIKRVLCRMTEKEQADVVLSRKAFFVRCCLKSYGYIKVQAVCADLFFISIDTKEII